MKDSMGFIRLGGLIRVGATSQGKMFTLPAGYRLNGKSRLYGIHSNTGEKRIDVNSSGEVILKTNASSGDFLSLEGVVFN